MNHKQIIIMLMCFTLIACQSSSRKTTKSTAENQEESPAESKEEKWNDTPFNYKNTIMDEDFFSSIKGKFSSSSTEDSFVFCFPKGLITETKAIIKVYNKRQEVVYEHIFKTSNLIENNYGLFKIGNDAEMKAFVLSRAVSILEHALIFPKSSENNAVMLNNIDKNDFLDYTVYEQAKNSNRAIFDYTLFSELHHFIAYDTKKKKAISIYGCC